MEANRSKIFKIKVLHFPAVFVFCKVNLLLFPSVLNMNYCVSGSVGLWSVGPWVGGFNKTFL